MTCLDVGSFTFSVDRTVLTLKAIKRWHSCFIIFVNAKRCAKWCHGLDLFLLCTTFDNCRCFSAWKFDLFCSLPKSYSNNKWHQRSCDVASQSIKRLNVAPRGCNVHYTPNVYIEERSWVIENIRAHYIWSKFHVNLLIKFDSWVQGNCLNWVSDI